MKTRKFTERFRITNADRFQLKDFDPADTMGLKSKEDAQDALEQGIARLSDAQERLYAQDSWGILLVLQAMDAAGKDSTIKHVMSGVNPQGCIVTSFKAPSAEDLNHDFLWRTMRYLPERGMIGIFNRSYYEEALIVRVHKKMLLREKLPARLVTSKIWEERFEDINSFERYLTRNGILVLKFFLHVSKKEQKRRFLERLDKPQKNWKFSANDVLERQYWGEYMRAYEEMIQNTGTKHAPWHVIPADHKWFTRLAVAEILNHALEDLDLSFPRIDAAKRRDLKKARIALKHEK
jgi:PPK2 family polyphosphate:nucleotide phosphotransferase